MDARLILSTYPDCHVFHLAGAHAVASKLNDEDDDGWCYRVVPLQNVAGTPPAALIEVFDETLHLLGRL